jgi:ClpP class serine protease
MEAAPSRPWLAIRPWIRILGWMLLVYIVIYQLRGPVRLEAARRSKLDQIQRQRGSRVIALLHRQDTYTLFGLPVGSAITIEDSEAVLRAIRLTPVDHPIDLILHTPGGVLLAAEQISRALVEHKGKVTVLVPHYAMSGGTLLALAADRIVMDSNAVLGPVDPQIGDVPAASLVSLLEYKQVSQISDEILMRIDVARKARAQTLQFVEKVLLKHLPEEKARSVAAALTEGRWTHDFPITVDAARDLGLPVSTEMPKAIYELMDLYPQASAGRPSVLYVPVR